MKPLGSGTRDRFITIEQAVTVTPASGRPTQEWTTLTEVWARKKELQGLQRFDADQLSEPFDQQWEIPYMASMDPELVNVPKNRRLRVRERIINILWAIELGRREGIMLGTRAPL